MISGPVQISQRFFHAILTSAQHHLDQVFLDFDLNVLNVKLFPVRLVQVLYQHFSVFDVEVPTAHSEVLQHVHANGYPFLYSNHAVEKKVERR